MNSRLANVIAVLICALFVITGSLWLWLPGIQSDEALFVSGIYSPFYFPAASIRMFQHDVGVMVMSYVGALKGHIWTPVFAIWGVDANTIRFPALILGAVSVWLFYRLLLRTLGIRAALAGCALLGTDVMYLLTTRWDWGPVALQHLLLIAGMLGIVTWWQTRRLVWLGAAFFVFGLALWDKALFAWSLVGLGVATLAVFPRELIRSLSPRSIAVGVVAFCLGAFLLIRYNVRHDWITFRSNTVWTTHDLGKKIDLLGYTLNGSALFGAIMRDDWEQPVREPDTALKRAVAGISAAAGSPRKTLQAWALALALILLPFVWRTPARRAILFALVFSVTTFAQMAFVENGAGGAHHTILLWPMPQIVVAAAFAYASIRIRRGALVTAFAVGVVCLSNLLVLSTYYTNLIRNGSVVTWTEAIYPATEAVERLNIKQLCVTDWGFFDNIRALRENRIDMCVADDPVNDQMRQHSLKQIANPDIAFIAHTRDNEVQAGTAQRIEEFAKSQGYRKISAGVFSDGNGRKVIEIFMFRPASGS